MAFKSEHFTVLRESLDVAERCAARFYCIPGREWSKYRYDVLAMSEGAEAEPCPGAFASLEKITVPGGVRDGRDQEFFRVVLDDARIIENARTVPDRSFSVDDLLVYVLTHELIHVIRFTNGMHPFDAPVRQRLIEERRVHRLTWDVLRHLNRREIDIIHAAYREIPLECLSLLPDAALRA